MGELGVGIRGGKTRRMRATEDFGHAPIFWLEKEHFQLDNFPSLSK